MTDRDPAFLWETEALRAATHRVVEAELDTGDGEEPDGRWVTLREASRATGIPVETLRKWARRGTIPSYLTPTNRGTSIRMVDLDGVEVRAAELGRVTTDASAAPPPAPTDADPDQPPPGTMLVPIDAWNKMLNQLGNLHEAGQQLAAARERAVKAETEAEFLRERLAEMRHEQPVTPSPEPAQQRQEPVEPQPSPEKVWQYLVRRYRLRKPG
ncbi:MAG: hypothetical protein QNJ81_01370 [Acidimicrobiia bacterium]|nr:hypothetical protein [Acidimicrobiia bacterium]